MTQFKPVWFMRLLEREREGAGLELKVIEIWTLLEVF
jgi:hypothetical protein